MFKKIAFYTIVFTLVGTISFFVQSYLLPGMDMEYLSLLKKAYQFHFVFSLLLVILFEVLSITKKMVDQLGFIYMALLVFKIVLFATIFYPQLIGDELLPVFQRAMILIPILIFLTLEVYFVSKTIQKK